MIIENVLPQEIEKRSFEIITEELGNIVLDSTNADVIKRVIHTTADFEYVNNLCFSSLRQRIIFFSIFRTCLYFRRR